MNKFVYTEHLGSLFIKHAGGYKTERALRERRLEICKALDEKKVNFSETLKKELEDIEIKLGEA